MLHLEEISKNESSVKILFDLLKNRKFNISHQNLPSYKDIVYTRVIPCREGDQLYLAHILIDSRELFQGKRF